MYLYITRFTDKGIGDGMDVQLLSNGIQVDGILSACMRNESSKLHVTFTAIFP